MGVLFLFLSVLAAMVKIIAIKNCGKLAAGPKNSLKINVIRATGCTLISLVVCALFGFKGMNSIGIITSVLSGICTALFLFTWILASQKASLAAVQVVCMLFGVGAPMILVPLISPVSTAATFIEWCGALVLIPASLCFSKKSAGGEKRTALSALPILLVMGLSNGGCVTTRKLYMELGEGTAADFNLLTYLIAAIILGLLFIISGICNKSSQDNREKPKKIFYIFVAVAVVTLYVSDYLNTLASGTLPVQLLVPLSYIFSMPLTLATDVILYKEKLTVFSIIGMLLVIASAILTSI